MLYKSWLYYDYTSTELIRMKKSYSFLFQRDEGARDNATANDFPLQKEKEKNKSFICRLSDNRRSRKRGIATKHIQWHLIFINFASYYNEGIHLILPVSACHNNTA